MSLKNTVIFSSILFLAGCAVYTPRDFTKIEYSKPIEALIYQKSTETKKVYKTDSGPATRGGYVCNTGLFGLVSWGSQSVDDAQRNGGLKEIHKVEVIRQDILSGFVSQQCLVVRGQ